MGWKTKTGIIVTTGALAASVVVPNMIKARTTPCTNACLANLKQIQGAMEMYGLENNLDSTNRVSIAEISGDNTKCIRPLINVGLTCPAGGTYSITTMAEPPRCSVQGHSL